MSGFFSSFSNTRSIHHVSPAVNPKKGNQEEETSQSWLLRRLTALLRDVDEQMLTDFILQQDITKFRNFMTDSRLQRVLFLVIIRTAVPVRPPSAQLEMEKPPRNFQKMGKVSLQSAKKSPKPAESKLNSEEKPKSKNLEHKKEPEGSSGKDPLRRTSKKQEKGVFPKSGKQKQHNKEILQELVEEEFSSLEPFAQAETKVLLKWHNQAALPLEEGNHEFVYILPQHNQDKDNFDISFLVGYCRDAGPFVEVVQLVKTLLDVPFPRQIDMFLQHQGVLHLTHWQNPEHRFENFIANTIVRAKSTSWLGEQQEHTADFIDNLLRPRIHIYAANPALFHSIELSARVLASNLQQRLLNLVAGDCPGKSHSFDPATHRQSRAIAQQVRPILVELLALGKECMHTNTDEFNCLEKIKHCLPLLDFIEQELQELLKLVQDLHDTRRDMTFERAHLEQAVEIVQRIWNTFEESYFESSLESGNYEALKQVYLQMADLLVNLKDTIPKLDKFC